MAIFCCMFSSCAKRTNGNLIGSWKSTNKDEGVEVVGSTIHMSSTILLKIKADGTYEKKTNVWIGDDNLPSVEKGKWVREGNNVTFTETSTETGEPFVFTQTITCLTDDNLVFNNKFEYIRIN